MKKPIAALAALPFLLSGVPAAQAEPPAAEVSQASVTITEAATGRANADFAANPTQAKMLARRAALTLVVEKACQEVEGANHGRIAKIYNEKYENGEYTITADVQVWRD